MLAKTAEGDQMIRRLFNADRNKLNTSVTLESPRHVPFSEEDFVRLYPLVPYQIQTLIDAVSARRDQGGALHTMGGSNRTLIRHTQQLLSHPTVGLAGEEVGILATLDRSYELLDEVIPTAWQHEVAQVAGTHGGYSPEARILRVIALCTDVPGLPMILRNLATCLHPSISAEALDPIVENALAHLVKEDRLRQSVNGYRLQSPEQKDWEKTRRGIDMKPAKATRLRQQILMDTLGSLTVSRGRTFTVALLVEGEEMNRGDIVLDLQHEADLNTLRMTSRSRKNRIYWTFTASDATWEALAELHRSDEMIERYDHAGHTDTQREMLGEERRRRDRNLRKAELHLAEDVAAGTILFRGVTKAVPSGNLHSITTTLVTGYLESIYPQLGMFSGSFKRAEVLQVLAADSLLGLPETMGPEGLKLFRVTASGPELVTDRGPIKTAMDYIEDRERYGEDLYGGQIERHFSNPPFGASVETIQAVLAGAMRAGLLEVISQANKITSASDHRLKEVFGNLPRFRSASFTLAKDDGPSREVRAEVSEWLSKMGGTSVSLDLGVIANRGRELLSAPLRQPCTEIKATFEGAGLRVPTAICTMDKLLHRLGSDDDSLVVKTMHNNRADLKGGRQDVSSYSKLINNEVGCLRSALESLRLSEDLDTLPASELATELRNLLDRARYVDDLAQIKSLTTKINTAWQAKAESLATELSSRVESRIETISSRYSQVGSEHLADAFRQLRELQNTTNIHALQANLVQLDRIAAQVIEKLDSLSTTRTVRHVRVAEVCRTPITTEADLESALSRLQDAVRAHLGDNSEVRLK